MLGKMTLEAFIEVVKIKSIWRVYNGIMVEWEDVLGNTQKSGFEENHGKEVIRTAKMYGLDVPEIISCKEKIARG